MPLSSSSINLYRSKCREGNGSMWERCSLLSITELCLQFTVGSGSWKRRWAPTLRSQSCQRVMPTMGSFTFTFYFYLEAVKLTWRGAKRVDSDQARWRKFVVPNVPAAKWGIKV